MDMPDRQTALAGKAKHLYILYTYLADYWNMEEEEELWVG